MERVKYPGPCCGYLVFRMRPGGSERCPICLWEDDLAQLRFPRLPGSANHVSLEDAQHNFAEFGSAERRHRGAGRPPLTDDTREQGWRALDPARDNIEEPQRGIDYGDSYPVGRHHCPVLLARNLLAAAGELTGSAARVGGRATGNIRKRFSKPAEL